MEGGLCLKMVFEYILGVLATAWNILVSPWLSLDTLWTVLPLVMILVLIHLYFGRYRTEELGWNSAFSNSISLLWVCVILARSLFEEYGFKQIFYENGFREMVLVGLLVFLVLSMLVFNYFHLLPKRLAFIFSSSDFVYVLAYVVISLIVGGFSINKNSLFAAVLVYAVLVLFLQLIKSFVPVSPNSKQTLKKQNRRKAGKKAARKRKINKFFEWVKKKF